jgi:hypothetical protein
MFELADDIVNQCLIEWASRKEAGGSPEAFRSRRFRLTG